MNPIVMTLIFSVVMLMFMAFPAMKIVEWLEQKKSLTPQTRNTLTIIITIILSFGIGLFLQLS